MYGYHGRYLRIDVTGGQATPLPLPEDILRRYVGGVGLGTWLLLRETEGSYDALAPESPLVFAFAPLAGTALNTTAKAAVLSKSPLTWRLNDAMMSSVFALAGKGTGYDALVITGRRPGWNTLFVDECGIRIDPTPELAGLSGAEAERRIREQHGRDWSVAAIGPAGEALVPFATISHDGRHAGRGGAGAVLGAKGLKAVAVRGSAPTDIADPTALAALRERFKRSSLGAGTEKYRTTGTLGNLLVFNRIGILPTDNFRGSSDPSAEQLSAERLYSGGKVVRATCADCTIGCEKRVVNASGAPTRVEYENVYALGAVLGNWDMNLVLEASRRCDDAGLDTITMGGTLAFARECVQRGLLDMPEVARPVPEFLLDAIAQTAKREGYGALLALGSRALAERVGQGSEAFAAHVKGLEMPGYHPGALQTLGLGFAVGARGADHNKSSAYDLDLSGEVDRFVLDPERIGAMVRLENDVTLMDTLILCKFVRRAIGDLCADGSAMLAAVTGWAVTGDDMRDTAQRIHHAKKLFNQRQGWNMREDTLPARFFSNGSATVDPGAKSTASDSKPPAAIDPGQFTRARAHYYELRGWRPDGALPSDPRLMQDLRLL